MTDAATRSPRAVLDQPAGPVPLTNKQSHADATVSDDERRWLVARAHGGSALVMTCATYVASEGQAWHGLLGISADRHVAGLTQLAEELAPRAPSSSVQLHHGGLRADADVSGVQTVAPRDDKAKDVRALTTRGADRDRRFVSAAAGPSGLGSTGVEVHGAHGYLVAKFLDGRHNHREDGYGGSADDRSRPARDPGGHPSEHGSRLPARVCGSRPSGSGSTSTRRRRWPAR